MSEVNNNAAAGGVGAGTGRAAGSGASHAPAPSANSTKLSRFVRASIPDFLLVLILSVGLDLAVAYAFNSAQALYGNLALTAAVEAVVLVVLFAGSWSKRALVPAAVVTGVIFVAAIVIGIATSTDVLTEGFSVNDAPGNNLIFCMLLIIIPVITFLLSRKPAGLVVLVFLTVLSCGMVQYLYRDWLSNAGGDIVTLVCLFTLLALFIFQTYRQSLFKSQRATKPSFASALGFSALLSLTCVLLGCVVFYGAVMNAGITTPVWKPFFQYEKNPIQYYNGIYEEQSVKNDNITTEDTNDKQEDTQENTEDGGKGDSEDSQQGESSSPITGLVELLSGYNEDDPNQDITTITYMFLNILAVVIAALVLAALGLLIFWRIHSRSTRLKKLEGEAYDYKVFVLYNFFVKKLALLRAKKPDYLTPREYASASARTLAAFTEGAGGVSFEDVTYIYERACVGCMPIEQSDYEKVEKYYNAFFKNARTRVGWFRWIFFKFWRI